MKGEGWVAPTNNMEDLILPEITYHVISFVRLNGVDVDLACVNNVPYMVD